MLKLRSLNLTLLLSCCTSLVLLFTAMLSGCTGGETHWQDDMLPQDTISDSASDTSDDTSEDMHVQDMGQDSDTAQDVVEDTSDMQADGDADMVQPGRQPCTPFPVGGGAPTSPAELSFELEMPDAPGNLIAVGTEDDLQAALDAAEPGDVIELQAGAVFTGNFTLPVHAGGGWVIVRSSSGNLAAEVRVAPESSAELATLQTDNDSPALQTAENASGWWLQGLQVTATETATAEALVILGDAETIAAPTSSQIVLDRSVVAGHADSGAPVGVVANANDSAIIDSWIGNIVSETEASTGVLLGAGTSATLLANNYISASGTNLQMGMLTGTVDTRPTDIRVCGNHIHKPRTWDPNDDGHDGSDWLIGPLVSMANPARVYLDGNVIENTWSDLRDGYAIEVYSAPHVQDHAADITLTRNRVPGSPGAMDLYGSDSESALRDTPTSDLYVAHNHMGPNVTFLRIKDDVTALTVEHNTDLSTGSPIRHSGTPMTALTVLNNIVVAGADGITSDGDLAGTAALNVMTSSWELEGNIIIGADEMEYPENNYYPPSVLEVGFVPDQDPPTLAEDSPFKDAATDGTDPGADMTALQMAIAGVVP